MFQRHLSQLLRGSRYPLQRERATLGSQIARDDLESLVDRTIRERDALPKAFFTTVRASRSSSFALEDASEGLSSLLHTFKGSGSDSSSSNRYASLKDGRHAAWRRSFASCAPETHSTTVLCVRKDGEVVVVADGQVTMGSVVVKPNVKKTRRIGDHAIGGFAGTTADAFTLFERLEIKLEEHPGQLTRAAVELAKMWRMDKYLRRLDASLIIADQKQSLQITGSGDVLEPHDGIISIGSGSPYALAAARALIDVDTMDAVSIARKAMSIASEACIYTNSNFSALHIKEDGSIHDLDILNSGDVAKK